MEDLVTFMLIDQKTPILNKYDYIEDIIVKLKEFDLILDNNVSEVEIRTIEDEIYYEIIFKYIDLKENITLWKVFFEFGSYKSSSQILVNISGSNYKLDIDNLYLESLKVKIKDIVSSNSKNIIWLKDKDSELLSVELYPLIYRVENLARQLISEIMTKEYGIKWWDVFVPQKIRSKHDARYQGYKSLCPSFKNVDERLMSIDIGDLKLILELKINTWHPEYNLEINRFLNSQSKLKIEGLKKILLDQSEMSVDLWNDQFKKYLPDNFIRKFKKFEKNRNHVVHNKLIDRMAYESILKSAKLVEEDLKNALVKVEENVFSLEKWNYIEEEFQREQEEQISILDSIKELEAGVNIRSHEEIINLFNEHLYELYTDIEDSFRFRLDLMISDYKDITWEYDKDILFEILYTISNEKIEVLYEIDYLDDSEGVESTVAILIKIGNEVQKKDLTYINGKVSFDSHQSNYMPEIQDEFSISLIKELTQKIIDTINDNFINKRDEIDSSMYSIIKDGGDSPVADISCFDCGENYININEDHGKIGQCLNCGGLNDISLCERCESYFETIDNGKINFCESCQVYIEKQ